VLVLDDLGGEPLDRLLGGPMEVGRFLRLAIAVTTALGKLHQRGLTIDEKPADIVERFFLEVVRPVLNRRVRSLVMWEKNRRRDAALDGAHLRTPEVRDGGKHQH
jgi:hypothetical protein